MLTLERHVKIARHSTGSFWPFQLEKQESELEVLNIPVLLCWLLGSPGFGRFGSWQAGILAMGQFGVKEMKELDWWSRS